MASYLITGANRGLGLWMVSYLLSQPVSVINCIVAGVRQSSESLDKLASDHKGRVVVLKVQVTDEDSVSQFAQNAARVLPNGLDVLINNVGIMKYSEDAQNPIETMENLREHFEVNVYSAHRVSKAMLPLLRQGRKKTILNVTSGMGSMARASSYMFQPAPAYKISKAALNMMTVQYAAYLEQESFIVFCINPGWTRTDMGSERADLDPQEAAESIAKRVMAATESDNGKFFDTYIPSFEDKQGINRYNGQIYPW